jgi:hypothetical protein
MNVGFAFSATAPPDTYTRDYPAAYSYANENSIKKNIVQCIRRCCPSLM